TAPEVLPICMVLAIPPVPTFMPPVPPCRFRVEVPFVDPTVVVCAVELAPKEQLPVPQFTITEEAPVPFPMVVLPVPVVLMLVLAPDMAVVEVLRIDELAAIAVRFPPAENRFRLLGA